MLWHVRPVSFNKSSRLHSDALEMFGRRNFVTAVLVIYLVLLILFFAYKEPYFYSSACNYGSSCVRFCCDDPDTCTNKFINAHFNASLVPNDDDDSGKENDVKYLFGRPDCSALKPIEADRQWQFSPVSRKASI